VGRTTTASGRRIAPRRRYALAVIGLAAGAAGCGTATHDNPAFTGQPSGTEATVPTTAPGSALAVGTTAVGQVSAPRLLAGAGAATANATIAGLARQLGAGGRSCQYTTTRADSTLASFRWVCSDHTVATATFAVADGRRLALPDLLHGGYLAYMASTAQAQLEAGGASGATATSVAAPTDAAFSRWGLSASAVQVTFPLASGPVTVDYPIATLSPYLVPGGLLH
jgi:hypothetical protein